MAAINPTEPGRRRLTAKGIFLLVILVALTPLAFMTSIVVDRLPVPYRAKVYAHLAEVVQRHAQAIDRFLSDRRDAIRLVAGMETAASLARPDRLKHCLAALQNSYGPVFEDIGFVDDRGHQVAYAGPLDLEKAGYGNAAWFKAAAAKPHFVSDVFTGLRGYPHFIVTAAGHGVGKRGILRATIDFKTFTALVESLRLGSTGHAFIVNDKGAFQTRPQRAALAVPDYWDCYRQGRPSDDGGTRRVERTDGSGTRKIIVTAGLKSGQWLLVFEQDAGDALSDMELNRKIAGMFFITGLLAILALAFFLRKRTAPGSTPQV